MMPDLFDPIIAPATGVARHCSAMGALKIQPYAAVQREKVVAALRQHGPLTDAELHRLTKISRASLCARRRELSLAGRLVKDGRTRKNPASGVSNALWKLVE